MIDIERLNELYRKAIDKIGEEGRVAGQNSDYAFFSAWPSLYKELLAARKLRISLDFMAPLFTKRRKMEKSNDVEGMHVHWLQRKQKIAADYDNALKD